ncbi:aromatic-L-amino-acid decarboxylase-like [Cherax quadricarinatus]
MDGEQFRAASRQMTDYIADYLTNIRERRVLPEVEPGYLRPLLPAQAPDTPDEWSDVMADIERVIMPGVTHWHSPHFHAYFAAGNSYPAILADMLSDAIGCIGFTWISSPACTELEVVMLDWLGQLLDLPSQFLAASGGKGGGVIQGTASEATLVAMLSAKIKMLKQVKKDKPYMADNAAAALVGYGSDQAHSSVERAGMMAGVKMRQVASDDNFAMRGPQLREAILKDKALGLIPFFVVGTMGATAACSFDNLREIGEVAQEFGLWCHVDAAYAGSAMVCEEFRYLMDGVELADSFNFNPHKWLLVNFDCSAMWIKDASDVVGAFNVDPLYLKHEQQGQVPDYRHWQIPLSRRFRSLKLWFVMRLYGKHGLQAHIRKQVDLAHQFETRVKKDPRFEIIAPVTLGLVCFRLKKRSNEVNETLLKNLNAGGVIYLVPAKIKDTYFLRFCVCSRLTEPQDVDEAWQEVLKQTDLLLQEI